VAASKLVNNWSRNAVAPSGGLIVRGNSPQEILGAHENIRPENDETSEQLIMLYDEELPDLYRSSRVVRMVKSRRL
jgi:hypothetical protein